MSDTDEALKALLRLQRKLIGRGSGASCDTDENIVKIRAEFKTIKDAIEQLRKERDEARQQVRDIIQRKEAQMLSIIEEGNGVARVLDCYKEDCK